MKPKILFLFVVTIIAIVATACGGGGGSGDAPGERPISQISGNAVDALIVGGDVAVYSFASGSRGELLGTGVTDDAGLYSVDIQAPDQPVMIEVTGGRYVEEASGFTITLEEGQRLSAVAFYESGKDLRAMITPWTHIAAGLAEWLVASGAATVGDAVVRGNVAISTWLDLDAINTYPRNITDPANLSHQLTEELTYGYIAAGLSSWTAWASEHNGQRPHSIYTSIALAQLFWRDIRSDGLLDGLADRQQLAFGTVLIDGDTYRTDLATHIIRITADEDANQAGITVVDILAPAANLATSGIAAFGGVPATPMDSTPPTIAALEPDGAWKTGVIDYKVAVSDFVGVKGVSYAIGDDDLGPVADPAAPSMPINTANYADGEHTITVTATDNLNNVGTASFTINIDNTGAVAVIDSPLITNQNPYEIYGTWSDNGPGLAALTVAGVDMVFSSDGSWEGTIPLTPGSHPIQIVTTDHGGNVKSYAVTMVLDVIPPRIDEGRGSIGVTYNVGGVVITDELENNYGAPIIITTDRLSANGAAPMDYVDNGIPLQRYNIDDSYNEGTYTERCDLIVESRYLVDDKVRQEWHPALRYREDGSTPCQEYIFAPVEEVLGEKWWVDVTPDTKLSFDLRVTDEAGNSTVETFEFKADIRPPEPPEITVRDNNFAAEATFANRDRLLDSPQLAQTYTFTNVSPVPLLLSLGDGGGHSLEQVIDTTQRRNRLIATVNPEWSARLWVRGERSIPMRMAFYSLDSDYTDIPQMQDFHCDGSWRDVYPSPRQLPDHQIDHASDTPLPDTTPTDWAASSELPVGLGCVSRDSLVKGFSMSYAERDGRYDDNSWVYIKDSDTHFRTRTYTSYASAPGYPRNESDDYTRTTEDYGETTYVVIGGNGLHLEPINGYYPIDKQTTYTVRKYVHTPSLDLKTDRGVADLYSFRSYTKKEYDRELKFRINREIQFAFVRGRLGQPTTGQVAVTVTAGEGQAVFINGR